MELHIKAIEAAEVPKMDTCGKSDPYLKFSLSTSSQTWKTKTKKNTNTPVWNEEFHLPITSNMSDELTIKLYDDDDVSKDDIISSMTFPVRNFQVGKVIDQWYSFTPAKGVKNGGKVRLVFHLDKSGKTAFKA
ncbi:Protein Aster-C [Tritrichomonas musculus]|uniref:Protein Aster-C n=1 Tax=Tritrichomonas musculus TaxID=1915356 RepID=A0ABR2KG14_9EUKA